MQKVNAVPYSRLQRKSNRDGALSKPVARSKNLSTMNLEIDKIASEPPETEYGNNLVGEKKRAAMFFDVRPSQN